MDAKTGDFKIGFACIEIFILNLAFGISVQCVGKIGSEFFYIKMCSSGTDFLIGGKCDTDGSVRNIFFDQALSWIVQGKASI